MKLLEILNIAITQYCMPTAYTILIQGCKHRNILLSCNICVILYSSSSSSQLFIMFCNSVRQLTLEVVQFVFYRLEFHVMRINFSSAMQKKYTSQVVLIYLIIAGDSESPKSSFF